VGDDAVALPQEKQHLIVPIVGAQRPSVMEHDGLTSAPILVEDFGAVLRRDHAHGGDPSSRIAGDRVTEVALHPARFRSLAGFLGPPAGKSGALSRPLAGATPTTARAKAVPRSRPSLKLKACEKTNSRRDVGGAGGDPGL
jgi:hypothetical protein